MLPAGRSVSRNIFSTKEIMCQVWSDETRRLLRRVREKCIAMTKPQPTYHDVLNDAQVLDDLPRRSE